MSFTNSNPHISQIVLENAVIVQNGESETGSIVVKDNLIQDVLPIDEVRTKYTESEFYDVSGFIITPGLANAHTHCALNFLKDLSHDQSNMIESLFFPAESKLTYEIVKGLSLPYMLNALKAGCTFMVDHYYYFMAVGEQIDRLGMRGAIGEVLADVSSAFPSNKTLDVVKNKIDSWSLSNRITPFLAPHATDTLSMKYAKEIADFAKSSGLSVQMHLSQTKGERNRTFKKDGLTPVEFVEKAGLLTNQLMAVHLVSADDKDLNLLKDNCAFVGLSPISQIIYEELAPIEKFFDLGLHCSLSTDCAASNDGADLLAEARHLQWLFKNRTGKSLERKTLWRTLSTNTYSWLKQPQLGAIAKGQKADLVFHSVGPENLPIYDPAASLVNDMGSKKVEHVMIDGTWVLKHRQPILISEDDIHSEFGEALRQLSKQLESDPKSPQLPTPVF